MSKPVESAGLVFDAMILVGIGLIVGGVAAFSPAVAAIVAGAFLLLGGSAAYRSRE